MASLKYIKLHLKSITNIQKITQTMKMVSAAKYARSERELQQCRPIGNGVKRFSDSLKITLEKDEKKILYVAITSDKGLCGGVHSSVAKKIRKSLTEEGVNSKARIVCVGEKSRAALQRYYGNRIILVVNGVGGRPPTFLDASEIADQILKSGFDFTECQVVYNHFNNVVSYSLTKSIIYSQKSVESASNIALYDSLDSDVVQGHLESNLASLIYYAMKEGAASEQSSRMTSMDNATKNAGEMIESLTFQYNRTRQSVITRELVEIISGASAIQG